MKGFKVQRETIDQVRGEILPLLDKHWEEIALNKDSIKLNPDWEAYYAIERVGNLGIYTCRKEDTNELVGYFVVIAHQHLHYKDHVFAENDIIYLHPELRNAGVGFKLIEFAENDLKELGVSALHINTKVHQPFDKLLEQMGYNNIERVYGKCFLNKE